MCVAVHQVLIHVFDIVSEEIEQDIAVRAAPNMRQNQPGVVPDSVHAAVPVLPAMCGSDSEVFSISESVRADPQDGPGARGAERRGTTWAVEMRCWVGCRDAMLLG